ncbi:MAG: PilZ domain-containing protein [Myxococcota bacterium]
MSTTARARQRINIDPLRVRFLAEGHEGVGLLTDISRTGLFIRSQELARAGAVVALQFRAPTGELIDLRGEVRWSTEGETDANGSEAGFGVLVYEAPLPYREFFLWAQRKADKDDAEEL